MSLSCNNFINAYFEFRLNSNLYETIKKWENEKIDGKQVNEKFGLKLDELNHYDSTLPKGMVLVPNPNFIISPNNPLFWDFVKFGHAEGKEFIKAAILYQDDEVMVIYNDKATNDKNAPAMSYCHIFAIPTRRIYNVVSLDISDAEFIDRMRKTVCNVIKDNFPKICSVYFSRILATTPVQNINDFGMVEQEKYGELLQNVLDIYNSLEQDKKTDKKHIENTILQKIDSTLFPDPQENDIDTLFHLAPFHSIGHLHMQTLYKPFRSSPGWDKYHHEMISSKDVVKGLKKLRLSESAN